ncbi:MAG: hypothetical protein QOJ95_3836 [Mycobacterium sp.]|nr:hypothetical protein [Mycobacterium sp.]
MAPRTQPSQHPVLSRLLDGGHTWGSLSVSPPRYGVSRYRLVVFPPGISAEDRMLLRAWRSWPAWGIAVFLILEILLVPTLGTGLAFGTSVAVVLGAGAVLMVKSGATRGQVRTLTVVRTYGAVDDHVVEQFALLHTLTETLANADSRLAKGEIGAVAHERLVWFVYDQMADDADTHS